jgi:hypothetical protein
MITRSRTTHVVTILAVSLVIAMLVVVTGFSHEDDAAPNVSVVCTGPDPEPGQPIAMPADLIGLEITLGLKDGQPTEWEGDVKVSKGRLVAIEVDRSGPNADVDGAHFSVGTAKAKASAKKKALNKQKQAQVQNKKNQAKAAAKKAAQAAALAPVLRVTLAAIADAVVTVTTAQGAFDVKLDELERSRARTVLDGQASVKRQDPAIRLTGSSTDDDYPVMARGADGTIWMVSVAYHPEDPQLDAMGPEEFGRLTPTKNGDQIVLRRFDGKAWWPAIAVTGEQQDVWRPTVAVDGKGVVWVAWAQPFDGNWEIVRRTYTPPSAGNGEGMWSEVVRVTNAPGSDFHVVAATDAEGMVWLAWQGWRRDNYEILVAAPDGGDERSQPKVISSSPANDWGPAIAADERGNVYVAWDTYDKGNYDVWLRNVSRGNREWPVADSSRFEGRPHVACDKLGRVWIAYEEGDEQWGKDYAHAGNVTNVGLKDNPGYALYVNRTVRVKCMANERLSRPAGTLDEALGALGNRNESVPRIGFDDDGGLWLLLRHHPLNQGGGEVWVGSATRYDGRRWSPLRNLAASTNLIDNRPALVPVSGGMLAVYSGDQRRQTQNRGQDDLYAARLASEGSVAEQFDLEDDPAAEGPRVAPVHPNEPDDVARIRGYRIEHRGKSLRLLRGEFHRHTELTSHNDQDGLYEDAWRYALDAGRLDWMGDGDHDNGFGHEYMWWLAQKVADIHFHPPYFVAAQTYERSVNFPNGHRNVMMPRRGIRPLPRGELPGTTEAGSPDTKLLYQYLKHFGGICASHTSGTNMGTDWRDNDPAVEPVVEIFQGHRHNYEHFGAPRSATEQTQIGGYQTSGFIWNALARGYRLGFQSSSDHVSTHMSYAVVLTDDVSRPGIIEAFRQRHSYAATDNIVLDVRSGAHLMGDIFDTKEKPRLEIAVKGTAPVAKIHVIRDNKYVFSTEPGTADVKLRYADDDARTGETHYYYVRVEQADGNLAWASPMWITYRE